MRHWRQPLTLAILLLLARPSAGLHGLMAAGPIRPADGPATRPAPASIVTPSFVARSALAGALAGTMLESLLYPIETIKTRLQTRAASSLAAAPLTLRGAFSGVVSSSITMATGSFMFFMVYEPTKVAMREITDITSLTHFAGATVGNLASGLIRIPNDVVKTRLQSGRASAGALATANSILKNEGIRGMYAGGPAWLMLHMPRSQLAFVLYEGLRESYQKHFAKDRDITSLETSMIGCAQGIVNGLVLTPIDTIRARLMVQGMGGGAKYSGALDAFKSIVATEGVRGVFAGALPRVVWMGLRGVVFFSTLELARAALLPELKQVGA